MGIVVINIVLEYVTTAFVKAIGYSHHSDIVSMVLIVVFISQFVNSGFILVFTDASFENTPLSFLPARNMYSDFTRNWYPEVGKQIVYTMTIAAFMPYFRFIYKWMFRKIQIYRDKKQTSVGLTKEATV